MTTFKGFPEDFYCQKVLPAVYDDSLSYYSVVCKLANQVEELINIYGASGETITKLQKELAELKAEFEKFKESGFDDYYAEQVKQWIEANLEYIYETTVKQVFFGLTSDGYFCAYIPESWNDISFDTGMVYDTPEYGRLILRYSVDGHGVIDNTNTDDNEMKNIMQRLALIEKNMGINNKTLYDPLNSSGVRLVSTGTRIFNPLG